MTNELAKKENYDLAIMESDWGSEGVDSTDILIPKILLMQGLSDYVAEGSAQMGDLVNSVSAKLLGTAREKDKKPVCIIPISTFKTWAEYTVDTKGGLKYKQTIPMTAANADLPLEDMVDNVKIRRDKCLNFYVLNVDEPEEFPYVITFKRTSYHAGKKLATHFVKCQQAKALGKPVPPAATMFNLSGVKTQNDFGTFYVFDVAEAGKTSPELLAKAYHWYQVIKTKAVKVDESDVVETETVVESDSEAHRF